MAPPSAAKVTIKGSPQQNLEKNIAVSPSQFEYSQAELQTPSPQVMKTTNQDQYSSIDARNQNAPSRNIVQSSNQRIQSHDMPQKPPQVSQYNQFASFQSQAIQNSMNNSIKVQGNNIQQSAGNVSLQKLSNRQILIEKQQSPIINLVAATSV